jgi:hypothetical protein
VTTSRLTSWLDSWAAAYPVASDEVLAPLRARASFRRGDVEVVYAWKFRRLWAANKIEAMMRMDESSVIELTARAFTCADELGALLLISLIPGAGAAGASAVLMAHDPERFTVMDSRAVASLSYLGLWSVSRSGGASFLGWPGYLRTCRELAVSTRRSLRTVDRALWAANGRPAGAA